MLILILDCYFGLIKREVIGLLFFYFVEVLWLLHVLKFGGSSVATPEKIRSIALYLKGRVAQHQKLVVVVSAMGKTTDTLLELAKALSTSPNTRELDQLLSTGEQVTISLLAIALENLGLRVRSLTGSQARIHTKGPHTKSRIEYIEKDSLKKLLENLDVVVVAGFQGINADGDVTTLGRGGSDTSAVALAATLETHAEIYTDVNGIYRTDPRIFPKAQQIKEISYDEMMEMSALGAKVMEMRSVEMGKKYHVPIYVGKTLSSEGGTWIMPVTESMEKKAVSSVALNKNILQITVHGIPNSYKHVVKIFKAMGDYSVNIDMITLSSNGNSHLTFTIPENEENAFLDASKVLQESFPALSFSICKNYAKLSVVGLGMRDTSGVTGKILSILENNEIPFYQITTSEISISCTIPQELGENAVVQICEYFQL